MLLDISRYFYYILRFSKFVVLYSRWCILQRTCKFSNRSSQIFCSSSVQWYKIDRNKTVTKRISLECIAFPTNKRSSVHFDLSHSNKYIYLPFILPSICTRSVQQTYYFSQLITGNESDSWRDGAAAATWRRSRRPHLSPSSPPYISLSFSYLPSHSHSLAVSKYSPSLCGVLFFVRNA